MNNLQTDIEALKEQQDNFVKLTQDVHDEMNRFEKEIENSANQLDDLIVESLEGDENDETETGEEEEDEEEANNVEYEEFNRYNLDSDCSD